MAESAWLWMFWFSLGWLFATVIVKKPDRQRVSYTKECGALKLHVTFNTYQELKDYLEHNIEMPTLQD